MPELDLENILIALVSAIFGAGGVVPWARNLPARPRRKPLRQRVDELEAGLEDAQSRIDKVIRSMATTPAMRSKAPNPRPGVGSFRFPEDDSSL